MFVMAMVMMLIFALLIDVPTGLLVIYFVSWRCVVTIVIITFSLLDFSKDRKDFSQLTFYQCVGT
jgi:hypothetical protein